MCAKAESHTSLDPGRCNNCIYSRRMQSDRGHVFFLCDLSFRDPRFPKYPHLPVLVCRGYQPEPTPEKNPRR